MGHYVVEILIWVMAVFFGGCAVGYALRSLTGTKEIVVAPVPVSETLPPGPLPVEPVVQPSPPLGVALADPPVEPAHMSRPRGLAKARGGKPDRLQQINGIGPKNEKLLHHQGFFHFDQIAQWTPAEVAWIDDHLKFRGRIARDQWVRQASLLAEGKDDAFRKEFGIQKRG